MSRFGFDGTVRPMVPYHGCVSFESHVYERAESSQVYACMAELLRAVRYRYLHEVPCTIEINSVKLDRGGYARGGQYWGTGGPSCFTLYFDAEGSPRNSPLNYYHDVRHYSRTSLRADLKRLFPLAKVGR